MAQSAISVVEAPTVASEVCLSAEAGRAGLLELFAAVSDGRSDQGRDHPVAVVMALAAGAVVAGMRGYTAIAGWVADVPEELRRQLYERGGGKPTIRLPPSKATSWRVVTDTDAQAFDRVVGTWLMARLADHSPDTGPDAEGEGEGEGEGSDPSGLMQVRLDGKVVRGATDGVEVADNLVGIVAVRDSKDRDGGHPTFSPAAWRAFVADVANRRP